MPYTKYVQKEFKTRRTVDFFTETFGRVIITVEINFF
jgi:hypothetical protein